MPGEQPTPILLTGAGFTNDFGGYLAKDMWSEIFNQKTVQAIPRLQEAMRHGEGAFNFEEVYDKVVYGDFSEPEKAEMAQAVRNAYGTLDEIIRAFRQTPTSISLNHLARFIERFSGTRDDPGLFFTLNQDLLIERRFPFERSIELPALPKGERFNTRFNERPYEQIVIQLPNGSRANDAEVEYPTPRADILYMKLHGSMEWVSHTGIHRPVIGTQKTRVIFTEPLLRWYLRQFVHAISRFNNRKLVSIGYGFRDAHINSIIAEACRTKGLRLFVVGPEEPDKFHHQLHGRGEWQRIYPCWAGYYRCRLSDLFSPSTASRAGEIMLRNLTRAVFEEE